MVPTVPDNVKPAWLGYFVFRGARLKSGTAVHFKW
jgi:hypothetical protein